MKKLHHRNIVALHAVIDDPEASKMYIVMDYVPNGCIVKFNGDDKSTCAPIPEKLTKRVPAADRRRAALPAQAQHHPPRQSSRRTSCWGSTTTSS